MDLDTPTRPDRAVKAEDDGHDSEMVHSKPSYRSWKKKYRKMRVVFEGKMREGENLYKLEQKALETANRLAVENDRLLDLLLDVNNCPQIPPDKRIDLTLDAPADEDDLHLPIDRPTTPSSTPKNGTKSYKQLLAEVPHFGFASAAGRLPELVISDLNTGRDSPADPQQGAPHPPTFLTADDIDNYIYQADVRLAARRARSDSPTDLLPTLAPLAGTAGQPPDRSVPASALLQNLQTATSTHSLPNPSNPATSSSAARDLALRNPTSVYNWLRKHAPKTFLQDHEISAADHHAAPSDDTPAHAKGGAASSRTSRGERPAKTPARPKKTPGSRPRPPPKDTEAMDLDSETAPDATATLLTPAEKKAAAKRKRVVDDDPGYRPKGGSSRPRGARKRKSLGGGGGGADEVSSTPTTAPPPAKKARKSMPAAAAAVVVEKSRDRERRDEEEEEEEEEGDAITARGAEED
ncbi:hypothetical protein CONLIGDRAFT_715514 [Coniochaeta ligniaria NRRL 30616]|uniref:IEC3 subunit of the Ino80 complex, chromatin re-modelling-domain-containing protein n=1 Tax=Coniochaeta ligniaria NRRL 30616 TaxID=1408157 RepID=A0A1J7JN23_9PEZI|nr:hypothetical protein CONLIGDRAFT_715514 [Coniochaeta ligniaria NRRL 30616]